MPIFARMNQARPLSQVVFAVMLVLALTLFPHHHHDGGAACWVEELCPEDGRTNDCHTSHGEEEQGGHTACCVQAMPLAKAQVRTADGDGWDGNPVFVQPERFSAVTPYMYDASGARMLASTPRLRACPFGRHVQRRGPPVCQQ